MGSSHSDPSSDGGVVHPASEGDETNESDLTTLSEAELRARFREVKNDRDRAQQRVEKLEETVDRQQHRLYDFEGSLAELQGVVEANASGDLTRRADIDSESDPIVNFVASYNRMLDEWNTTLKRVKNASRSVDGSTSEVETEIEQVDNEAKQVRQSIGEIADGANEQNYNLQQVGEEMRSISATIEQVAASATQVASTADESVASGSAAQEAAEKAVSDLEQMESKTGEMVTQVEELSSLMSDIEEITQFIDGVAEDTSLLALNTNIEAARAGEAGEGFAVVANEVKNRSRRKVL